MFLSLFKRKNASNANSNSSKSKQVNKCGQSAKWELDNAGTLTISGTGAMSDYQQRQDPFPPYRNAGRIKRVVVKPGITAVGKYAFSELTEVKEVSLPEGLLEIREGAFCNCNSLEKVSIPASIQALGSCAFDGCSALTSAEINAIHFVFGQWIFAGCKKLTIYIPEPSERGVSVGANIAIDSGIELELIGQNNNADTTVAPCEVILKDSDRIEYDEGTQTLVFTISGKKEKCPRGDIEKIVLRTSDAGPFEDDLWAEIHTSNCTYKIMSASVPLFPDLVFELLAKKFQINQENMLNAMTSLENREFLLYKA